MATPSKSMTTREFAKATGIPAATISKLIREGKLKAKKEGQSWMIPQSQLAAKVVREFGKTAQTHQGQKAFHACGRPHTGKSRQTGSEGAHALSRAEGVSGPCSTAWTGV